MADIDKKTADFQCAAQLRDEISGGFFRKPYDSKIACIHKECR